MITKASPPSHPPPITDRTPSAVRSRALHLKVLRKRLATQLPAPPWIEERILLYQALGFEQREPMEAPMPDGTALPIIRMERSL